jgi:Fur family transcriptional regulator, ferric uptake regulator
MGDSTTTIGRVAFGDARLSAQREAIARAARDYGSAFSAEDLLEASARTAPGVGIATVYRAVSAMEAAGFIEPVGTRSGATLYIHCPHEGHHHHVVCTGCGAVAAAECSVVDSAKGADGFIITDHDLTLYGLCPRCQR